MAEQTMEHGAQATPAHEGQAALAQTEREQKRSIAERGRSLMTGARTALRRPGVGATATGVTVLAAGAIWGVTEAVVAAAAAYAVFRSLKKSARRAHRHARGGEAPTPA